MHSTYLSRDDYLSIKNSYKEKNFLHLPSHNAEKFNALMPWKEINRLLRQNRWSYPRLRLQKEGEPIPESAYTEVVPFRRGGSYNKIIEPKLYEQIENGSTLIIDAIDELYEELDTFVGGLERFFKNKIQVNAYMSWGDTKGFTTHWDDHDVLIFQIFGKKNWFIFDETRRYPLYKDLHDQHDAPNKPTWNKIINAGDILFIPRGQWHHAIALNEPSLHLTFGFNCRTGLNYMQWLTDKLTKFEIFRKDIPAFASEEEINNYYQELMNVFSESAKDSSLSVYINDINVEMEHRPHFSLPWGISTAQSFEHKKIKLNVGLISNYTVDLSKDSISFFAKNKFFEFSAVCDPFFKLLMDYDPHSFTEVLTLINGMISRAQVEDMVKVLVKDGLIAIVD